MPTPPKPHPADRLMSPESSRRVMLRRFGVLAGATAIGGPSALLSGCGGGGGDGAMPPPTVSATSPTVGAHNLAFNPLGILLDPISTQSMNTQASGSTILACVGRGNFATFSLPASLPTDNMGNAPYVQQGVAHRYALYQNSGTALYAFQSAVGGSGHVVTTANNPGSDEITLAVVEVVNGGVIQAVQNEVLSGNALTSLDVATTGPATLVAFWWGDDGSGSVTAVPNNGFTIIDSQPVSANAVECVVATKDVSAAGTYNVTWSAAPLQGAQLWLVAVQ